MVAVIKFGSSLRKTLSYNERKLSTGQAELLLAGGFPTDEGLLGFSAKMRRFQPLLDRNPHVQKNSAHVFLSFPPEEQLSNEKLQAIAMEYLDRIGFAGQPFLVYRHLDTHNSHLHIVTTHVKMRGKPINVHKIGDRLSNPARKAIEVEFGLIPAESRKTSNSFTYADLPFDWVEYGKEKTKHYITNVTGFLRARYAVGSFEEWNTLLAQFGITADRGSAGSRMAINGGLVYSFIDKGGARKGVPIKASDIFGEPTLKNLEVDFAKGRISKIARLEKSQQTMNAALAATNSTRTLHDRLAAKGLALIVSENRQANNPQYTIIDHRSKTVFSTEEIGLTPEQLENAQQLPQRAEATSRRLDGSRNFPSDGPTSSLSSIPATTLLLLGNLLHRAGPTSGSPDQHSVKKKKKKKGPHR